MGLLSGILLTCVVVGIVGFLLRELLGDSAGAALQKYTRASPGDTRDPVIGGVGHVLEGKEGAEFMKVRVGGERWNANFIDGHGLVVGTEVTVTAVNGLVLDVEECSVAEADD